MELGLSKFLARSERTSEPGITYAAWEVHIKDSQAVGLWVSGTRRGGWFVMSGPDATPCSEQIAILLYHQRFATRRESLQAIQAAFISVEATASS